MCSKILMTELQDLMLFPRLNLGDSLVSLFILDHIGQVLPVGCRRLHSLALVKGGSQALWSGELGDLGGGLGFYSPLSPASKSSHSNPLSHTAFLGESFAKKWWVRDSSSGCLV